MFWRERSQLISSQDVWTLQINNITFPRFLFKLLKQFLHLSPAASLFFSEWKSQVNGAYNDTVINTPQVSVASIVLTLGDTGKGKGEARERWTKQDPCSQEAIKSYSLRWVDFMGVLQQWIENKDSRLGQWPSFLNISTDKMSQSEHNSSTMRSVGFTS